MSDKLSQALAQADEYKRLCEIGDMPRARQCREMIALLMSGRALPCAVACAMGRLDLAEKTL